MPAPPRQSSALPRYILTAIIAAVPALLVGFLVGRSSASSGLTPVQVVTVTPDNSVAALPTSEPSPLPPTWTPTPAMTATPECWLSDWWDNVEPIITEFMDTAETATQTARMSLSPVILELNSTYREFESIDYPDCARSIRNNISSGMNSAVQGFNDFLGQNEFLADVYFSLANQYFWNASELIDAVPLFGEYRLSITLIIWGGDEPNAATATAMAATHTP